MGTIKSAFSCQLLALSLSVEILISALYPSEPPALATALPLQALSTGLELTDAFSYPLLCHDHGPDDGDQQKQGRDFKGEHVIAVQHLTNVLRIAGFGQRYRGLGEQSDALHVDLDEEHAQSEGGQDSGHPLMVKLLLFLGALNVDQHDDEQEQHHDSAHVKNDLHAGNEGGVEHQVEAGDT